MKISVRLRHDAKVQLDSLIERCENFQHDLGALHQLVVCNAARLLESNEYLPRTEVRTISVVSADGTEIAIDFRVGDGLAVIIEGYSLRS